MRKERAFGNGPTGLRGQMSLCQAVKTSPETSKKLGYKTVQIGVHINRQVEKTETVSLQTNHNDGSLKTAWKDCPTGVNSHQQDWRVQKGALGVSQTSHFQGLKYGSPKKQREVEKPASATAKCQDYQSPGQPKRMMGAA